MNIELPKTKLPPTRKWPKRLFLYGQPKVGKTTLLSQLDDCLIIETDPDGAVYVEALKLQVNNLEEFRQVCDAIISEGKKYKYVALDTATFLEDWCVADATNMYRSTTIGKNFDKDYPNQNVLCLPNGAGYLWLRLSFQKYINLLVTTSDYVIITGHLKDKFIGTKSNNDVAAIDIDLTGQIKRIVAAGCDAIGYLFRTVMQAPIAGQEPKQKLKVSFKTTDMVNCGSRCPYLAGQEFDFDWNKIYPKE